MEQAREARKPCTILRGNQNGKDKMGDLGRCGSIILK